jgi:hypothetical protein
MKCLVRETTGEDAITMDDGQAVHDRIKPELVAGSEVELDFDGVAVFASPFFNAAIGQLLKDIDPETLNRLLRVENLNALGHDVLRRVIDNSKRYYISKEYRDVQARVVQRLAGEAG